MKTRLTPLRAMIVDDNPDDLAILDRVFRNRHYEVCAYSDPVLSPVYVSTGCPCSLAYGCPDVVVCDFVMPRVNGAELVEALVMKGCRCRHYALISGDEMALRRLAKHDTRFFPKPLDLDDFYDWLNRVEHDIKANGRVQPSP